MQLLWGIAAGAFGAILLIWFGYPMAMWLVARMVARPIRPDAAAAVTRRVSVVLATRERPDVIRRRVENLLDTDHPTELLEVIIALDAEGSQSSPESLGGLGSRVRATLGDAPGGKACALNAGVRAATGDVLVLADAAQRFDRKTIPALVAALEDRRFGAVSGALSLGQANGSLPVHWYWAMEKRLRFDESLVHSSIGVTGAVYATRRALWPTPPAGTLLDDVFVPMSLVLQGHRVGFVPSAYAEDIRTFDSAAEKDRKTRTLTGVLQLLSLLPPILSMRNPVLVQFVLHKLARMTTPLFFAAGLISGSALAVDVAARWPQFTGVVVAVLTITLIIRPALRSRVWTMVQWCWALQYATVLAAFNGLSRRWSVWSTHKH